MKIPLQFFVLTLLSALLLGSCCKSNECKCYDKYGIYTDDCSPKHYGPYPLGAAYDYLYFKPGSWWIYQNSLTNEFDTIKVLSCDTTVIDRVGNDLIWNSITYTTLNATWYSTTFNTYYRFGRIAFYPDNFEVKYVQIQERTAILPGTAHGPIDVFSEPPIDLVWADFDTTLPSLFIKGKEYFEVRIWKTNRYDNTIQLPKKMLKGSNYGSFSKYYWAKGVGIAMLESEIYDYNLQQYVIQKWELVDSYLIH